MWFRRGDGKVIGRGNKEEVSKLDDDKEVYGVRKGMGICKRVLQRDEKVQG